MEMYQLVSIKYLTINPNSVRTGKVMTFQVKTLCNPGHKATIDNIMKISRV